MSLLRRYAVCMMNLQLVARDVWIQGLIEALISYRLKLKDFHKFDSAATGKRSMTIGIWFQKITNESCSFGTDCCSCGRESHASSGRLTRLNQGWEESVSGGGWPQTRYVTSLNPNYSQNANLSSQCHQQAASALAQPHLRLNDAGSLSCHP